MIAIWGAYQNAMFGPSPLCFREDKNFDMNHSTAFHKVPFLSPKGAV
jgi:hypothetical protein